MTISHFTDHAANERTFLAWVRTGIAVMAFGFLVERFGIFLKIAGATLGHGGAPQVNQAFGNVAGLCLIVTGAGLIAMAALRFHRTAIAIDSAEVRPGPGRRMDVTLGVMLLVLGIAMTIYLIQTLGGG